MRRRLAGPALGGILLLVLAGCSKPGGVDGDLTDDWAPPPKAQVFVPEAGTCHPNAQIVGHVSSYNPVDCGQPHEAETTYVGTFTGELATRATPPPAGSPAMRAARAQCETKSNALLGGDWHGARLLLAVVLPPATAWSSGARWFRCDLLETHSVEPTTRRASLPPEGETRTGSLKGELARKSPLAHTCFEPKFVQDNLEFLAAVDCTKPHHAEYAGVYTAANTTWAAFDDDYERTHTRCRAVVAAYTKVPNDRTITYRTGTIFYPPTEQQWNDGDRGVRCFLWISDRKLTRSLKGAGPSGLPVR